MEKNGFRLMRLKEVMTVTGLSRAAVYAKGNPNDPARYDADFPPRVRIAANAVGWPSDRLQAWLDKCLAAAGYTKGEAA